MWPDELAKTIIKERGKKLVVSCMVTPSGPIHLGNLREIVTGYLISEALKKNGANVSFLFFADNFDPLRKLYPFLPKESEKYIGAPLSEIPDPFKCHDFYDQHFLRPLFKALEILKIKPEIYFVDKLYKTGKYTPTIKKALQNQDKIAQILEKLTGKKIEKNWSPFMPLCQKCGKLTATKIRRLDLSKNLVFYQCKCGFKGEADFSKGEGKLTWRVHWPSNWKTFNVGVEGFGKDHATKGGAYETGRVIIEQIFGGEAPYPVPYEWIYIKDQGPMASSTGVGFTPLEILEILPPEILLYFYQRSKPNKHLLFNPAEIAGLWNEYGGLSGIPFEHLAMVVQSAPDFEGILSALKRTGYEKNFKSKISNLKTEIKCIKNWLKKYAPEHYKFEVQDKIPQVSLSIKQKKFLSNILKTIEDEKLDGEKLHQKIHQIKKEMKIDPREAFSAIYLVFLGKDSGPQAGWFLAGLDRQFVVERLKEVVK